MFHIRKTLCIMVLIVAFIIQTTPAWASMKISSDRLEVNGEVLGEAVTEEVMDQERGTYMGFYFSVLFEGFWDTLGNYNATLLTNTNAATDALMASLPEGTQVNISASVSGLGNNTGVFTIVQVPGSGNIVTTNLILNIQIVQVLGNTVQNLTSLFPHL
jgi:hypothetical protein